MAREYTGTKEDQDRIGEEALCKMIEYELSKSPSNFELWFAYSSGQMPQLEHVINQIIKKSGGITNAQCLDLFQEYIDNSEQEQKIINQTSDRIEDSIESIQILLSEAQEHTKDYGGSLKNVAIDLNKADSIEAITAVVTNMVQDTQQMVKQNSLLEQRLESSADQVNELKLALENVQREALTDGLTGLANRKCFDMELEAEILNAQIHHTKLCLVVIDIDHFKKFNDSYGHQVGDQVLKLVGNTLINGVKGQDMAARYGGEEFVLILPETPMTAAVKVSNNLRERIGKKEIVNRATNTHMGQITISAGVAEYQPGEEAADLIKRADDALYAAKNNGRNRVEVAHNPYINVNKGV